MLDMAVLGLLREGPMHGYEIKRRLVDFGFWRISFGSVYPALRRLEKSGRIESRGTATRRKEYAITEDGAAHFEAMLRDEASEVENTTAFRVRLAFFRYMEPDTRIGFLERRKVVLRERIAATRTRLQQLGEKAAEAIDAYTMSLMEHGVDSAEADIKWLDDLIEREKNSSRRTPADMALGAVPEPS